MSVSRLMRREDIGGGSAWRDTIAAASPKVLADGGSCVAGPDGEWLALPAGAEEQLLVTKIDYRRVLEERQNFHPSGHYARADVTHLEVDRGRQAVVGFRD